MGRVPKYPFDMTLKVLGSSSKGNCYLLDNGRETLAIEAGVSFAEVKKAVDFDISRIVGCIASHEHADHSKEARRFIDKRIPLYASRGTFNALGDEKINILEKGVVRCLGGFSVLPFEVKHDAAKPFGFLIHHVDTGSVLFATDTFYLPHTFSGLNNILIECNYRMDILEENTQNGSVPAAQRNRTLQSHMSYDTCLKALLANDLSAVNNIVLIHLSDRNSNAKEFEDGIREATGKTVHVASKGMILEFNKTPF
jgi:phosphoribosyl 1,2-cyclic phosphodiesterase